MLTFLDAPRASRDPRAQLLTRPDGDRPAALAVGALPSSRLRLVGVLAQPPHVVMGLRGWEDAFEGVLPDGTPFALFEIEKIARMLLRQDGLALEILAAPERLVVDDFEPRDLVSWSIHRGVLAHYRDVTAPWLESLPTASNPAILLGARELLTGVALARHAALGVSLDTLLGCLELPEFALVLGDFAGEASPGARARDELALRARDLHAELDAALDPGASGPLPARPPDYDALHHAVYRWRMQATS